MAQVFVSIGTGHHLSLVLFEHEELAVTDFANFAQYLFSILKTNTLGEGSRAHPAICAVLHRTKLALHVLLFENDFASEAISLLAN